MSLARDEANTAQANVNGEALAEVAKEIAGRERKVTLFVVDVSDRAQIYAAVDHATKELNGLDIMVSSAGVAQV